MAEQAKIVDLKVFPPDISLHTRRDSQSVVVQAIYDNGITRDVTDKAAFKVSDASLVSFKDFIFHPAKDGQTELQVAYGGLSQKLPVKVSQAVEERPISYKLDVMPVFMRAGCNSGSCHGAARGKDGFRMSLFGFDPDGDYDRIVKENIGRRINLAIPRDSLMLTKGAGQVQHTGGELFKPDSPLYNTVLRWLEAGAPKDPADIPTVTDVEVYPKEVVLEGTGSSHRITVRATYSDGTTRDVTQLAALQSNNDVSIKVAEDGTLSGHARGEAFIMARFETFTVGVSALAVPQGLDFVFPEVPANNFVDELVYAKLKKLRIAPSELTEDAIFLRRVYLDLIGQLPTPAELENFLEDLSTGKRDRVIDELLDRPEFADMWVMKWGELLRVRSNPQNGDYFSDKNTSLYYNWLRGQILKNAPVDKMVRQLISATGSTFDNPAANFYKLENDVLKMSEDVAQVFMGMRIQCAQCHNHPFDRWTMDDYYSFAAFFAQVGRKQGLDPRDTVVYNRNSGEVKHLVSQKNMAPKFLGGAVPDVKGQDRRKVLADWLASPENGFFARNIANMVWAHFMGRGIIEPVDDVRVSNPPVNGALLDALADFFATNEYDFKKLVRQIVQSRTYQLSTRANDSNGSDNTNFSKAGIRRLRAEVLLDSINQVTNNKDKFRGMAPGSRAVQIADGNVTSYFLTTFGRATRETVCSCEVVMDPSLSQALHLLNGNTVNTKVQSGGVVRDLLKSGRSGMEVLNELYLKCFSRRPTEGELAKLKAYVEVKDAKELEENLNDLFWSMLNSKEFMFNH